RVFEAPAARPAGRRQPRQVRAATRTSCIRGLCCRMRGKLRAALRKAHGHARATTGLGVERHAAAVQLHQALDDRQAEPRTAMLGTLAAAFKTLEHPALLLLWYAHAAVLDHEGRHTAFAPSLDADRGARLREA